MNDIIAKISSYNIFNNLVPGAIFAFLLALFDVYHLASSSVIVDVVVFYFLGMVVSRVGSVVLDPLLMLTHFLPPRSYSEFITASAKDEKIVTFLETGNMYRTILSVLLLVILSLNLKSPVSSMLSERTMINVGLGALALLFLASYLKQNAYIGLRIEHHKKE